METEQAAETPSTPAVAIAPSASSEVAKANAKPSQTQPIAQPAPKPQDQEVKPKGVKPEGWDKVDFQNDPPDKIEHRFNRLFKQTKQFQRDLQARDELLAEQSAVIKELHDRQNKVVNHIQNQDFNDAETKLIQARKEARANGDDDRVDAINDQLAEIKLKKLSATAAPKQQPQQPQRPQNATEAAKYAVSQGALAEEDQEVIQTWQEEADEYGEPLRPWALASDPEYVSAVAIARSIMSPENKKFAKKSMAEKLAEVDRRMGLERQQPRQEVMPSGRGTGGDLTRANGKGNMRGVQMSENAVKLAIHHKMAGPGKSNDEHIEAYRQQIAKVRGNA
jgi:hypothetical protein